MSYFTNRLYFFDRDMTFNIMCVAIFPFISLFPAAHLRPPPRVAQNAKTLSAVSLMECMEQGGDGGGGTVLLESYESTCDETVPLQPSPAVTAADKEATTTMATVAMETVPLSSSVAAKEEEERGSVEEKEEQPLTAAQHEEVKKEEGKCLILNGALMDLSNDMPN